MTMMAEARMGERRRSSRFPPNARSQSKTPDVQTPVDGASASPRATNLNHSPHQDQPTEKRNLRKRKEAPINTIDPIEETMKPLTDIERQNWKGWVELESDPVIFNYVLQSYGVKDIKVQEILDLDMLQFCIEEVHGMIFLFQYQDSDANEAEDIPKCPKHVWFANQTADNSCATVALLNIVFNTADLDLGEALTTFKQETRKLKPAYRGKKLGENDYIRNIHNSFVRRIDILNADLALQNEYDSWVKRRRIEENLKSKPKTSRNARSKAKETLKSTPKKNQDDSESGFHFIAYVPVNGSVWKLDGLRKQPVDIGRCGDNWTDVARDNMLQRIESHTGSIQYNLMTLVESPLVKMRQDIAETIKTIEDLQETLSLIVPDWKAFIDADVRTYRSDLLTGFDVTQQLIDGSTTLEETSKIISECDPPKLLMHRKSLGDRLVRLKSLYMEEISENSNDSEKAEKRRLDYTPDIYRSIKAMSENGALKDVVLSLQD